MLKEVWYSADFHLMHSRILEYSNRPFNSVEEMNQTLIDNINEAIQSQDVFYFLGDFCFSNDEKVIRSFRESINCRETHLIFGNHDHKLRHNKDLQKIFSTASDYKEIRVGNQHLVLSHYSFRIWNRAHYGSYHLYGHSHGSLPDDPASRSFDVGVDCWDYRPINMDKVNEVMSRKVFKPIDHHGASPSQQEKVYG